MKTLALVGVPNAGKSTLFNALTGLRQHVGNFPGVTVEPVVGTVKAGDRSVTLIDLPGIYSFTVTSADEQMAVDVLNGRHKSIPAPDAILLVIDSTAIEKGLTLFTNLAATGRPLYIAATMVDAVKARGGVFDDITLQHKLGVPVFPVVGNKGLGLSELRHAITLSDGKVPLPPLEPAATPSERSSWSLQIAEQVLQGNTSSSVTRQLDRWMLHPFFGTLAFLVVMALFFQSIFTLADPIMGFVEDVFSDWQRSIFTAMPGVVGNFLGKALVGGVGSVLVFLPQIVILNILVTVLEESGYLARTAFLVDRAMGMFGLQGRSFIPLLGSFACAIPGIMSARIIPDYRHRMATIMATPLMTCSARLPVYTLLIAAVVPTATLGGIISLQGAVLASLYLLGLLSGLAIALLLRKTVFKGGLGYFLMEFPEYRMPGLKSVIITTYNRTKDFVITAGTIILAFSVILWILTELPRAEIPEHVNRLEAEQTQLENSLAADLGKFIQPVFEPLGFDWKITLGVIGSYAARETFVAVMGQVYAADVSEGDNSLREVLQSRMSLATGLSLLAFYVYALQCISTMAIMKRETGSWRWPALAFGITFVLAYLSSFVVYSLFSL